MTTIVLDGCENAVLKNFSVDFERPTMSEMRYASVTSSGVDLEVHPDSRYSIQNGKITWFGEGWKTRSFHAVEYDTTLKTMRYSDWKTLNGSRANELRHGLIHFDTPSSFQPKLGIF